MNPTFEELSALRDQWQAAQPIAPEASVPQGNHPRPIQDHPKQCPPARWQHVLFRQSGGDGPEDAGVRNMVARRTGRMVAAYRPQGRAGENIDELNDVEKELAIFIRNQQENQDKVVPRSIAAAREIYELGLKNFLALLTSKLGKLSPLFASSEMTVNQRYPQSANPLHSSLEQLLPVIEQKHDYKVIFHFRGYKGQGVEPFSLEISFHIHFDEFRYVINANGQAIARKSYAEPVLADEAERLATAILADAFTRIKGLCGHKDG